LLLLLLFILLTSLDHLQLITIFIQAIAPFVDPGQENPAVKYCGEILPIMSTIAMNFTKSTPILERVCRCWRYMIISYRTAMTPLLPNLAQSLAAGFEASREGCFLWATDAVVREFSDGAEHVDRATSEAVFHFYERQSLSFLRILNELPPEQLPDGRPFWVFFFPFSPSFFSSFSSSFFL
jgi:transportin-3